MKVTTTKAGASARVKVLVYGVTGIGKTRLIATAPKPLIISCEGNLLSLRKENIPVIKVSTLDDLDKSLSFVRDDDKINRGVETICLDSLSDIAERILLTAKKQYKDNRQAFGELFDTMLDRLKQFSDLDNYHLYCTAKETRRVDKSELQEKTSYVVTMPSAKLIDEVPYNFDEFFRFVTITNKDGDKARVLSTREEEMHIAKDQSGALNRYEKADLCAIFKKIQQS